MKGAFIMIAIGCDHAGCEMKKYIIDTLSEKGFEFVDMGWQKLIDMP